MFLLDNNSEISSKYGSELSYDSNNKTVTVLKEGNIINIDINTNKLDIENEAASYIKTKIVKNTLLKTTETYIRKIFVHAKNEKKHYVVREIFIDRNKNKKIASNKCYRFSLHKSECINTKLQGFLNNQPLMLV